MKNRICFAALICIISINSKAQTDITQDIGWPRQISNDKATLVYYQPQIDKWDNYKKLSGRMAFSLTPAGKQEVLGVVSFTSNTKTDKDARTTYLHNIDYQDVRFPSLDSNTAESMKKMFLDMVPKESESFSTDRIMAELNTQGQVKAQTVQTKNDPPKIFYSASPAILLIVDGDPVLSPIDKTDIQFVVNTNWDLFFEKSTKNYFLLVNDAWLTATYLQGPWKQTQTLPKEMSALPAGQNFDEVKNQIPPHATTDVPEVFYSNEPAELILTEGTPVFSKIPGTRLLYVSNSENDVFADEAQNQYYILLSGRWFRSKAFGGPWTYAGNDLPADFAKIPEDSPKGQVLASVPGTIQASDAVMLAQIPTTVIVNKAEAEAKVKATYDGDPKFAPIQGTSMEYATNTQDKIIKVGDLYYMCFQAVWFMSTTPNGPWKTADSVPEEIYTIPPSSPVYNVTYVTQINPTSTTVESCSTSGYLGAFIIGATVGAMVGTAIVYGTGWYYPPYIYWPPGRMYPVYHPWPCTYGVGTVYNPWTGGFAAGRRVYGPYGATGTSAWYNPATGRYGRSASAQGWYGGRTAANTYNPWTGAYGHTNQGHNPYAQWGHSTVSNGYQWARSGHVTTAHGTAFGYQTSGGKEGVIVHGANGIVAHTNNHVYAGQDGNIYRRNPNGNWSQHINGSWNHVNNNVGTTHQSTSIMQNLNRSAQSRERGEFQSSRFQSFQRDGRSRFRKD
ncbi:MAG: hypothetical protein LBV74_14860 [Tannerella sp.]|jgi:hypothetical protein|nr:hypothetical protein [Tannerella sp.]